MFSRITGVGSFLPGPAVSNGDLARRGIETNDDWISSRTGIRFRHLAENGQTASDLGFEASQRALQAAGLTAADLDLIIVATSTPDFIFPSTACLLQCKLGNRTATAFDVQAVCSGFVYALTIAEKFIRSGSHRRALVVGAEVFSRILDWSDRGTCVLFGDGAGAVVLEAAEQPGILATALHADGAHHDILAVPGSICGGLVIGDPFLRMDGQAVFKFAVRVLAEVAEECCAAAGLPPSAIDWLIPHQANVRILEATAKRMKMPMDKVIVTVDRHGNTSAASVPLALDEGLRDGRIRSGQRVMLEGVGGGFTWGAVLLQL
ncbi:MAG: ketoacyl-ACP synthase III [Candidatus Accumulibacter sp.]|uniref:beta-ketoacyl-ACP synthase III n=1 Tax=Accumulibacter sp. TaxID=2053492 RepID=UPI001A62E7FF|nr:beta-ketoacyl-ACP synthase III [Accumulibacter sp.]MBL8391391.1 ketoacyl-ACP synthase III [Accumulibacter sp.]HRD88609.1 beta-ketoacyl-ACP synthase III [Accumulibacter sp.]